MRRPEWKTRITRIVSLCQGEIKKTTEIGKRMLSASKTNSCLHEAYEDLGTLVARAMRENRIEWGDPRAKELLTKIDKCEKELEEIENEVKKIKFSSAPKDISRETKRD